MTSSWSDTSFLAAVEVDSTRVLELARSGDLSESIGHLPRWKRRDLVAHLGGVHRWATEIVNTSSMDGPGSRKSKLDGVELCDWFEEGAEALVAALESKDPHGPCPNFNPGSEKVFSWWARRQAHETAVHRWDMEASFGETRPIDSALAADGVDEFLDVFVRTRGKQTLDTTLVLTTSNPGRSWTLRPAEKPGRIDVIAGRDSGAEAEVVGDAEAMLLALWGRLGVGAADLDVQGDTSVALHLFAP